MFMRFFVLAGTAMHMSVMLVTPASAQTVDAPEITRDHAVLWALRDAPEMAASEFILRSREHQIDDAQRRLNPRLDVSVENFAGSGAYSPIDRAETTATIMQTYERGGDRRARAELARQGLRLAEVEARIAQLDLIETVETNFLNVQIARARVELAEQRLSSFEQISAIVDQRVRAAREPVHTRERMDAQLTGARIDIEVAVQSLEAARADLTAYWNGDDDVRVVPANFHLADLQSTMTVETQSMEERYAAAQRSLAEARISQEVARATPDIDVGLQARHFQNGNEAALGFQVSIPLQVRNNNRSRIASARSEMQAADRTIESVRRSTDRERRSLELRINRTTAEIERIDAWLLPQLVQSLESARSGYRRGTATYLEIFDAQMALNAAFERRIDAFADLYLSQIRLRRLSGTNLLLAAR